MFCVCECALASERATGIWCPKHAHRTHTERRIYVHISCGALFSASINFRMHGASGLASRTGVESANIATSMMIQNPK